MPVKNQGAIGRRLETVFMRCNAPVQARALGKGTIVAVVIQNTFNLMDGTPNNSEIMVGTDNAQTYQMLPGQESPVIYAHDLADIWIRVRDLAGGGAGTPVDVTVLVYKERKDDNVSR